MSDEEPRLRKEDGAIFHGLIEEVDEKIRAFWYIDLDFGHGGRPEKSAPEMFKMRADAEAWIHAVAAFCGFTEVKIHRFRSSQP